MKQNSYLQLLYEKLYIHIYNDEYSRNNKYNTLRETLVSSFKCARYILRVFSSVGGFKEEKEQIETKSTHIRTRIDRGRRDEKKRSRRGATLGINITNRI